MRSVLGVLVVALMQATVATPPPPVPREIAAATWLVPGAMLPDRGPDGNTVIIAAPHGLVVIDTGRHSWHSDAILAFARDTRLPVSAIVNTHWHLDHSSGNRRVTAAHPGAKVYTTTAVDRAIAPGGFLTRSLAAARSQTTDPKESSTRREERALFLATMAASASLRPDIAIATSATMTLAGRPLSARVAADAVTDADLWLFDDATGVAVLGDLVTLPAPFFETACPARWQQALDAVMATPFRIAVPGHGPVMSRAQVEAYRRAFGAFRTCVAGTGAPGVCASDWSRDLGALLGSDADRRQATEYAAYYVSFLRKTGGRSADCRVE